MAVVMAVVMAVAVAVAMAVVMERTTASAGTVTPLTMMETRMPTSSVLLPLPTRVTTAPRRQRTPLPAAGRARRGRALHLPPLPTLLPPLPLPLVLPLAPPLALALAPP